MSPFECYQMYLALTRHFSSGSYDFNKYNGKINVKRENFNVRKDKYIFEKLSDLHDQKGWILANVLYRDIKWAGDLIGSEAKNCYDEYIRKQDSLSYLFSSELNNLLGNTLEDILEVKNSQHPYLLKSFIQKKTSLETLVILDQLLNFTPYWSKNIIDQVLWPTILRKIEKYSPFVKFDIKKVKTILSDRFEV